MNTSYPAIAERSRANAIARRITEQSVKDRRTEAQAAIDETVRGLSKLHEITGPSDYLDDTLAGLLDVLCNVSWGFQSELDNAGIDVLQHTPLLDLSEIHALLAKARS